MNSLSHRALQGEATVIDEKTVLVCSEDLTDNYCDLEEAGKIPKWQGTTISCVSVIVALMISFSFKC